MTRRLVPILLAATLLFVWRIDHPAYSDTEGMFAEPAREMVLTGDWVTPRMNGEPFLTKPPLAYWLAAAMFSVAGPTEYARLVPALAALATLALTASLGAMLFGEGAGIAAAVVLATSAGFVLEARMLRADMILVLAIVLALWAYVRLGRSPTTATAVVMWTAIAFGALDKGLLALVLPLAFITLGEILDGRLRPSTVGSRVRALRPTLGVAVLLVVAGPWHVLASLRNPGFAWDYFINQHILVFFDAKLPRDSIPDTLGLFWTMFVVRGLPWSLFLPAALLHAWRIRREQTGTALLAAWLVVVLLFFSLAAGRLEHYSLPALPAAALLLGALFQDALAGRARVARAWLVAPPIVCGTLALLVFAADPRRVLAAADATLDDAGLVALMPAASAIVGAGLLALGALVAAGYLRAAAAAGLVSTLALFSLAQLAHERVEPMFSWRPISATVRGTVAEGTRVFFRAEDEYQLCGGLDYYTGRYVDLLAPPGWVPPTFLEGDTDRLFTPRTELDRAWREGKAVLVADDVPGGQEAALVPGPYSVLVRAGDRVLLGPPKAD